MITSRKISGAAGHYAAYLSEQAEFFAAYHSAVKVGKDTPRDTQIFNEVEGSGAALLGLERGMTLEQFEDIGEGRWNGQQLCQKGATPIWARDKDGKIERDAAGDKIPQYHPDGKKKMEPARTSWIDSPISLPKSVIEYMIATDDETRKRILDAFDQACKLYVPALEERAYLLRKTINGEYNADTKQQGSRTERVRGAKIIAIPVTQFAARHTQETIERGTLADPLLHRHYAIATLAFLPDDTHPSGYRPLTIDQKGVKAIADEANAMVMGEMARLLEEMGIAVEYEKWEDTKNAQIRWEVAGISKELMRFHSTNSKRRDELIEKFRYDFGHDPSKPELEHLMITTRKSKSKTVKDKAADLKGAWTQWKREAQDAGFDVFMRTPGQPIERAPIAERRKELMVRLFDIQLAKFGKSPQGFCVKDSRFTGDKIMLHVQKAAVGLGFTQDELKEFEQEVRRELVIVEKAADERYTYYTTPQQRNKELRIEKARQNLSRRKVLGPNRFFIEAAINRLPHKPDAQQVEGIIAASNSAWCHIEGFAGAGKSSTIGAARDALQSAGLISQTVVLSTAAKAAQESAKKIGGQFSGSIESIERQIAGGKLKPDDKTLWIIDEAAMLDTDRLDRLFMAAKGRGRFVMVGDPAQLTAIGPAGWYEKSVAQHGSVMITKSHRFKGPDADNNIRDYTLLRSGNVEDASKAIENLDARGRVHIADDSTERMVRVISDYKARRNGDESLTADDIRIIIEGTNKEVDTANNYVQLDRKARGELRGEGIEVNEERTGRSWKLHENDSIIFNRPVSLGFGKKAIKNGTIGVIKSIEDNRMATIEIEDDLSDGRRPRPGDTGKKLVRVRLHEHDKTQAVAPSYAQHALKVQGQEVKYTQVLPGHENTATSNSAYSQLTRGIFESHIYLDHEIHGDQPKENLAEMWANRVNKKMAIDYMRENGRNPHEPTAAERAKEARERREARQAEREEACAYEAPATDGQAPEHEQDTNVRTRVRTAHPKAPEHDATEQQPLIRTGGSLREKLRWSRDRDQERDEHNQTPFLRPFKGRDRDDNDRSR